MLGNLGNSQALVEQLRFAAVFKSRGKCIMYCRAMPNRLAGITAIRCNADGDCDQNSQPFSLSIEEFPDRFEIYHRPFHLVILDQLLNLKLLSEDDLDILATLLTRGIISTDHDRVAAAWSAAIAKFKHALRSEDWKSLLTVGDEILAQKPQSLGR